jgi:predicted dehydrogenase
MNAIAKNEQISPNFHDGLKEMEILTAGLLSAKEGKEITIS